MRKRLSLVSLGIVTLASSCNSGVGPGGDNDEFSSCYAIGFTSQDINDIYNSALIDRDYGNSHDEERWVAANSCASSCYYEAVCANGCTSCAYDIIDSAYSKTIILSVKSVATDGLAIDGVIEGLFSSE